MNIYDFCVVDGYDIKEYLDFCLHHSSSENYQHKHHILPRWRFPEYTRFSEYAWNCSHLSLENHLEAHKILASSWPVWQNISAVVVLSNSHDKDFEELEVLKSTSLYLRYGVFHNTHIPGLCDKAKEKRENTIQQRYGVSHYSRTEQSRKALSYRMKTSNPMHCQSVKQIHGETLMTRYGVTNPAHLPSFLEKRVKNRRENEKSRSPLCWITDGVVSKQVRKDSIEFQQALQETSVWRCGRDPSFSNKMSAAVKDGKRKSKFYINETTQEVIRVPIDTPEETYVREHGFIPGRNMSFKSLKLLDVNNRICAGRDDDGVNLTS